MTFTIKWASRWDYSRQETFNSLEELKAFAEDQDQGLIIYFDTMEIWVYDDYIE